MQQKVQLQNLFNAQTSKFTAILLSETEVKHLTKIQNQISSLRI